MTSVDPRNDPAGYDKSEPPYMYTLRDLVSVEGYERAHTLRATKLPTSYTLGDISTHITTVSWDSVTNRYHQALGDGTAQQLYSDLCTAQIQEACRWFYDSTWADTPFNGVMDITLTDDEVRTSISRLDLGENYREAAAYRLDYGSIGGSIVPHLRYVFTELPWKRQRALIERLYDIRREWGFAKLGPVDGTFKHEPELEYERLFIDDEVTPEDVYVG